MKLSIKQIQELKKYPNSIYTQIKQEFLYHSNKIEGSTFTKENLALYLDKRIVDGRHSVDDVLETINSVELFDFVILTINEPITKSLILEFHRILKKIKVAQPYEVEEKIESLIEHWNNSSKSFEDIVEFHKEFEQIHPFQDGNGRVGRFIMLKQCIENDIDLIAIDEKYEKEYKSALEYAQADGEISKLLDILKKCQNFLEDKNEELVMSLKALNIE